MSKRIKVLIDQLVSKAKTQGLSQAQLAEMANLTPVGLSKAKHRGDLRVSTLVDLADSLDLELALVPSHSREKATAEIKTGVFFRVSASQGMRRNRYGA